MLSTPPAFILSQDRTLEIIVSKPLSRSPSSLGSPRALRLTLFGSNLKSELLYSALFIFLIELYFFISSAVFNSCLFASCFLFGFAFALPPSPLCRSSASTFGINELVLSCSCCSVFIVRAALSRTAQLFYHITLQLSRGFFKKIKKTCFSLRCKVFPVLRIDFQKVEAKVLAASVRFYGTFE